MISRIHQLQFGFSYLNTGSHGSLCWRVSVLVSRDSLSLILGIIDFLVSSFPLRSQEELLIFHFVQLFICCQGRIVITNHLTCETRTQESRSFYTYKMDKGMTRQTALPTPFIFLFNFLIIKVLDKAVLQFFFNQCIFMTFRPHITPECMYVISPLEMKSISSFP